MTRDQYINYIFKRISCAGFQNKILRIHLSIYNKDFFLTQLITLIRLSYRIQLKKYLLSIYRQAIQKEIHLWIKISHKFEIFSANIYYNLIHFNFNKWFCFFPNTKEIYLNLINYKWFTQKNHFLFSRYFYFSYMKIFHWWKIIVFIIKYIFCKYNECFAFSIQ